MGVLSFSSRAQNIPRAQQSYQKTLFYFEKRKESRDLAGIWCEGVICFVSLVWDFSPEVLCCGNLPVKMEGWHSEAGFWRLMSFKVCQPCNSKSRVEIEYVLRAPDSPECRLVC